MPKAIKPPTTGGSTPLPYPFPAPRPHSLPPPPDDERALGRRYIRIPLAASVEVLEAIAERIIDELDRRYAPFEDLHPEVDCCDAGDDDPTRAFCGGWYGDGLPGTPEDAEFNGDEQDHTLARDEVSSAIDRLASAGEART